MKPDLEEKSHAKYRISNVNVKGEGKVQELLVGGGGGVGDEDIENYETSLEAPAVSYKEILNEDELQKLKAEFSRLKSQFNPFTFAWICYTNANKKTKIITDLK